VKAQMDVKSNVTGGYSLIGQKPPLRVDDDDPWALNELLPDLDDPQQSMPKWKKVSGSIFR